MRSVFLKNILYPKSKICKTKYNHFLKWSLMSQVCGSSMGAICMDSLFHSVSTAYLSYNYIGKDIVGQTGSLLFLHKYAKESDTNPRKYVNRSLAFEQTANFIECAIQFLPTSFFIPLVGLANVGKNISWISVGALNTKCIQSISKDGDLGEVYTKIAALNTLASSLGMIIGLGFLYVVPNPLVVIPFMTIARVVSYKKAITVIQ